MEAPNFNFKITILKESVTQISGELNLNIKKKLDGIKFLYNKKYDNDTAMQRAFQRNKKEEEHVRLTLGYKKACEDYIHELEQEILNLQKVNRQRSRDLSYWISQCQRVIQESIEFESFLLSRKNEQK